MFKKTLSKETARALEILGCSKFLKHAYLAGGTACALQLGHRISIDLDFFTPQKFDEKNIIRLLQETGKFELEEQSEGTILGQFEKVKFSLFVYPYPVLFPFQDFDSVQLADIRDIAAMKVDAIASRGIKRDFIDLFFILKQDISLKEILSFYDRKYKTLASHHMHLFKSLVYFEDAEASPIPRMLSKVEWKKVRSFFEGETKKLVAR